MTHSFSEKVSAQFLVLNGWQNISESNSSKAVGTQVSYQITPDFDLTYNTFFGSELGFRNFHDLVFKYEVNAKWSVSGQLDLGFQDDSPVGGSGSWYGFTLISRTEVSEEGANIFRAERYSDPKDIIASTPSSLPFRAWGASLGYDHTLIKQLVWRNKVRAIFADQDIYLTHTTPTNEEALLVTSLDLSL